MFLENLTLQNSQIMYKDKEKCNVTVCIYNQLPHIQTLLKKYTQR